MVPASRRVQGCARRGSLKGQVDPVTPRVWGEVASSSDSARSGKPSVEAELMRRGLVFSHEHCMEHAGPVCGEEWERSEPAGYG